MRRALTAEEAASLRGWLRADAIDKARELRDAGWEEHSEHDFWRLPGKTDWMGLHDAYFYGRGGEP